MTLGLVIVLNGDCVTCWSKVRVEVIVRVNLIENEVQK